MRRARLTAVLFAALLPTATGAFELPQPGETVCYGRAYGDSHLAQHPGQVARTLVLELIDWKDYEGLGFFLNVVLADDPWHTWGAGGACYDTEEGTLCAIDCDGGAFLIEAGKDGDLLLKNAKDGFAVQQNCGDEMPEEPKISHIPADQDNGVYRLVRLPDDFCPQWEEQ